MIQRAIELSRAALIMIALVGWAATWGIVGVAYAQGSTFPLYISPEFEPLKVELLPPPPEQVDAALTESPPLQAIPDPLNEGSETNLFSEAADLISKPLLVFQGITGASPPDTVLDVGRNHIVQMVNRTQFQIWDKQGNALAPCPGYRRPLPPFRRLPPETNVTTY
jgi:hypothetical protein